ncbi:hypothetical protein PR202_gb02582 [Eleusine coracana subsp. coracana]|uniref:CBS domain-containing protein n=1 Tax=Eleusine coracana subsp. coracana TaxID=191504 RepID=A0AAV5DYN9_ELECO|nr:hypothetical protein PR202_gb02582 [Eleusine coracana subsp. coracana]
MAHVVFLRTAAADLTAGKPPLKGVPASAPLSAAAAAIPESQEAAVAVWRDGASPQAPAVVGLLSSLDVVAFLASHVGGPAAALRTPAGDVVAHEPALVREVEPHARLIEIVELMKQGALRVLVRKNITEASTVDKKPFAPFFKAELKVTGTPRRDSSRGGGEQQQPAAACSTRPSSPPSTFGCDRYCCLTREDIVRFLINCLGALAPVPMQPISALGAVNRGFAAVEATSPAIEAAWRVADEPRAVAVVQTKRDGSRVILADVSAHRLWRRDYVAAADAMATLSSLNFAAGVDGSGASAGPADDDGDASSPGASGRRARFAASLAGQMMASHGGNAALTCRTTSSLAAVMAQMLSYRATHIWVTEGEDDVVVGVVGYMEVLKAVTMGVAPPAS